MSLPCPRCDAPLSPVHRSGIEIDHCARCRGVWLDRGELEKLIDRDRAFGDEYDDDDDGRNPGRAHYANGEHRPPRRKKGFFGRLFDFD